MFKKSINNSGIKNMIDMYNEMNFWLKLSQECNYTFSIMILFSSFWFLSVEDKIKVKMCKDFFVFIRNHYELKFNRNNLLYCLWVWIFNLIYKRLTKYLLHRTFPGSVCTSFGTLVWFEPCLQMHEMPQHDIEYHHLYLDPS